MVFCRGCGKEIHESAAMCPHCGATQQSSRKSSNKVGKSKSTAGILAIFFRRTWHSPFLFRAMVGDFLFAILLGWFAFNNWDY